MAAPGRGPGGGARGRLAHRSSPWGHGAASTAHRRRAPPPRARLFGPSAARGDREHRGRHAMRAIGPCRRRGCRPRKPDARIAARPSPPGCSPGGTLRQRRCRTNTAPPSRARRRASRRRASRVGAAPGARARRYLRRPRCRPRRPRPLLRPAQLPVSPPGGVTAGHHHAGLSTQASAKASGRRPGRTCRLPYLGSPWQVCTCAFSWRGLPLTLGRRGLSSLCRPLPGAGAPGVTRTPSRVVLVRSGESPRGVPPRSPGPGRCGSR